MSTEQGISHDQACKRLRSLGFRKEVTLPVVNLVDRWVQCNGYQWTIDRLKSLKVHALKMLAGVESDIPWVATGKDGIPKGPFRPIFESLMSRDVKKATRGLNALMLYTQFKSGTVTPAQWKKFSDSVENPPPVSNLVVEETIGTFRLKKVRPFKGYRTLSCFEFPLSEKRSQVYGLSTVSQQEIAPWLRSFFDSMDNRPAYNKWPHLYEPVFGGLDVHGRYAPRLPKGFWDQKAKNVVGKIGFIQEPGFKLRAVAVPHMVHQIALDPLKKYLLDILRGFDADCTHDQMKGVERVKGWLSEGKTVHSVDLSDATNNFPLSLQEKVLRGLSDDSRFQDLVSCFCLVSRSPWAVKDPETGLERPISWAKGQPLGLGPSFPAFALSHHFVLVAANRLCKEKGRYVILGDDIAIVGDELAKNYRGLLAALGCPISESKTLKSSLLAEFAGKVITPDKVITTAKWRELSDRNFLDLLKELGPSAIGMLRPRQRKVVKLIQYIPEFEGGLGWNPKGLPLQVRYELVKELGLLDKKEPVVSTSTVRTRIFQVLRDLGLLASALVGQEQNLALRLGWSEYSVQAEGKATSLSPDLLTRLIENHRIHDEKLTESQPIPEGLLRGSNQPSDPRGLSTLEQWESRLAKAKRRKGLGNETR